MTKQLTELKNFEVNEVSIVDKGANKKKRFPIVKQESNMNEEIIKAVLDTEVEGEAKLAEFVEKAELDADAVPVLKGMLRLAESFKDKLTTESLSTIAGIAGYEEPVNKAKGEEKKAMPLDEEEEDEEEEMKMKKSLEGMPEEVKKQFDEITKAHDEEMAAMKEKHEAVAKALKEAQDLRELESWVTKAKEELSGIPGKSSEELGAMFKSLADKDKDMAEAQFAIMKDSAAAIKKSVMFNELGGRGEVNTGSAMDKLTKAAAKYVEKSEKPLTKEQAIAKALNEDPSLYDAYLDEHPAQAGK